MVPGLQVGASQDSQADPYCLLQHRLTTPLPPPQESESRSVMSDSLQPHGLYLIVPLNLIALEQVEENCLPLACIWPLLGHQQQAESGVMPWKTWVSPRVR